MSERLQFMGQKEEKKLEAKRLKLSIEGLRDSLRAGLNPFSPISNIQGGKIAEQAFELADKLILHNTLEEEIKAIDKALGAGRQRG